MAIQFHKSNKDQEGNVLTSGRLMTKLTDPRTDLPTSQLNDYPLALDKELLVDLLETDSSDGDTRSSTSIDTGYAVAPLNPATPAVSGPKQDFEGNTVEGFKFYMQDQTTDNFIYNNLTNPSYEDPTKIDYDLSTEITRTVGGDNTFAAKILDGYRPYIGKSVVGEYEVELGSYKNMVENTDPKDWNDSDALAVTYIYHDYFIHHFYPQLRLVFFKPNGNNPFAYNIVVRQKPLKYDNTTGRETVAGSTNQLFTAIDTPTGSATDLYEALKLPFEHDGQTKTLDEMVALTEELRDKFIDYDEATDDLSNLYQLWFYKKTKVPLLDDSNYGTDAWNDGYGVTTNNTTGASASDFAPYFPDSSNPYVTLWMYASKDYSQDGSNPVVAHDQAFVGPFTKIIALKHSIVRVTGSNITHNKEMEDHAKRYFQMKKNDVLEGYFPEVLLHPSDPAGHIALQTLP